MTDAHVLKRNLCFDVNRWFESTCCVTLYPPYERQCDECVVERARELPLRPRLVRLPLDHEQFDHAVVLVAYVVLPTHNSMETCAVYSLSWCVLRVIPDLKWLLNILTMRDMNYVSTDFVFLNTTGCFSIFSLPDKLAPHVLQCLEGPLVVGPLEGVEDGGADQQVGEGHHHQRQRPHVAPPHLGTSICRITYFIS